MAHLRLHYHLLASYLLLLLISLSVIGAALFIFVSTRPTPPEQTYERLGALLQGLTVRDFRPRLNEPIRDTETAASFDRFAEANGVRLMMLLQTPAETRVYYDSAGLYRFDESQLVRDASLNIAPRAASTSAGPDVRPFFGSMPGPDGEVWLVAGITASLNLRPGGGGLLSDAVNLTVLLSEPRPTMSLQETLSEFSSSLLPPIIQAGVVGGIVAVMLAVIISRSIARPLRTLAEAATAIAKGDYGVPTPKTGPLEVRLLAEAFDQMSRDVQGTWQSQRDFLANVSHDLKTPLTSIQGYSQAIMDGATKDPADAARVIHDEAGRLNRMVVELTELARIQSGRLSLKMTGLDVGEIAAAIGQRLAVVARSKQIELHIKTGPMPIIAGDGDRLAQVLTNLLSNAIKYTEPGGHVTLQTSVEQGGVQIVVRDTGVGIPQKDLPRVFERFYQVDKARGPKRGTGLGLAITQEIIQAHGGTIRVHSEGTGKGTTFTIWLPSPQLSTIMSRR